MGGPFCTRRRCARGLPAKFEKHPKQSSRQVLGATFSDFAKIGLTRRAKQWQNLIVTESPPEPLASRSKPGYRFRAERKFLPTACKVTTMMKSISADMIPEHFWRIRYDPNHDPNTTTLPSISESPNCQNFAYALLKHFGFEIFPFRSSNLWKDGNETSLVSDGLRPLDLLLFNRTENPWGAHVALHLGEDHAIHLSKKQSEPVIWPLARFLELAEYRTFIGAKRLRNIAVGS